MAKLLYQGHGSYRITADDGRVLYVDPYAGEGYDKPADIVLITHEHSDHISGLTTLTKQLRLPVYASPGTGRQLCYRIAFLEELLRPVAPGEGFSIGGLAI